MATGRTARRAVTLARIAEEALALVDSEGLERLSMRRLGTRLGVEAMALYHHLPSKSALLDLLLEQIVLSTGADVAGQLDWRGWIESFASSYRGALLKHPALLPLVATRPIRSATALQLLQTGAHVLVASGFTPARAQQMLNVVGMFVTGHALAEVGRPPASSGGEDQQESREAAELLSDRESSGRRYQDIFDVGVAGLIAGFAVLACDTSSPSTAAFPVGPAS